MRFLIVKQRATAEIFGATYTLNPLDPDHFRAKDVLVMDNGSASELLERHRDVLLEAVFDTKKLAAFPRPLPGINQVEPGARVLILRAGGVGDHVMLLPALKALKQALPDVHLSLATQKAKHPVFYGQKCLNRLLPLPVGLDEVLQADHVVDFSYAIDDFHFNTLNMTDFYLRALGLDPLEIQKKSPRIVVPGESSNDIQKAFERIRQARPGAPVVILERKSSVPLRDFPKEPFLRLSEDFPMIQFVTTKSPEEWKIDGKKTNIVDISPFIRQLDDYIAAFSCCDGAVSTDMAAYHLAEAFNKPCLALFGPILAPLRTRYYEKTFVIQSNYVGQVCAAPCGLHKSPNGCPESIRLQTDRTPCLADIHEATIRDVFQRLVNTHFQQELIA